MPTMIGVSELYKQPRTRTIYFDMDGTLADLYGVITAGSRFPPGTPSHIQAKMNADTQREKKQWLMRYGIAVDEFRFVPYGTPKINAASDRKGILIDDEDKVLRTWPGMAVKASPANKARF